ncbi:pyruvate:ferredoxin (flavodoxin) oxidoreductase [Oscillibacter sp.]|uniref:pyruvate:ferredoxin (flavodoxin) oxidoreductase n=1 Tax=Oscillibacter sp. TaxID=1945593 RepID=UPI0026079F48|nr:pyruvate:ferredoxin (flavodoxin) oxidoreductase [Oscillibacter sp.]MDD3346527.1 pyruvate:ferredoxin (flavodoxin) oxidoreductase [Oscillibacter sp.]
MDGNTAAAYASYAFTEVAAIYPITPSSQMAEAVDEWASQGKTNLFGKPVKVIEMQSEAGAAGTCHGSLQAGALTTTYTAAQGLLLMIPPMFRMAGEFLPAVFHVSARTVASNMWSIFGDHSDVMTCRSIGFAMLASSCPQEAMDLGAVAHLAAIKARHPFMHFFDGFRTSHEMQKIDALEYEALRPLVDMDQVNAFRKHSLNPEHPHVRGTTASSETYFQGREGGNSHYAEIPEIVQHYMDEINKLTGRNYHLYDYYGAEDATEVVVAMGSGTETMRETVDYLNKQGRKVGMISVHLFRPFSAKHFLAAMPASVKKVAVLDRTKESGSVGEPLFLDVKAVLTSSERSFDSIVGGRFGLAGKDTTPSQIVAVYENLAQSAPKTDFTIGIEDDVTFTSLPTKNLILPKQGEISCKLWGTGGDGTVGANKNSVKIIGGQTEKYAQAYFVYDAKKSGGVTQSHLRFSDNPIHATYLVQAADFVAVHNAAYLEKFDVDSDLKEGGTFLLNCQWNEAELEQHLPGSLKRGLAEKNARFYTIDASDIAMKLGLGNRTNSVLQSAFFKLADIIPMDTAITAMKDAIKKTYLVKAGQKVVDMNCAAVDEGVNALHAVEIPESWKNAPLEEKDDGKHDFLHDIFKPLDQMQGDKLPVSIFQKYGIVDGTWPNGTSKNDKRADAIMVPEWDASKCIQCNQCAYVCPHAAIRPVLVTEEEKKAAPAGFETIAAKGPGLEKYGFRIQVSPYDCLGCGCCVNACLAKDNALTLKPAATQAVQAENWTYGIETVPVKKDAVNVKTVKGSQFAKPYYEFPPACAGCGETAYIKLVTQLFGERMYIANASGCTAAHGGSLPSTPYCTDDRGFGPPWEQSLFEDNAEFAFGFLQAHETVNSELVDAVQQLKDAGVAADACEKYLAGKDNAEVSREVSDDLLAALESADVKAEAKVSADFVLQNKEFLSKKSVWAFGGDGWAYDIGFGGLDHVLASGKDINMLVLDTEVYSNTGGQSSKATNVGAVAQFAAAGKRTKKKDLGMMLMSYGYIYVAQVAMGADPNQTLKALREAEAYPGPSVVICYAPCTSHGIPKGMSNCQQEMKRAVEAGYWHLYRYNPMLREEGKNPFTLDSKAPANDFIDFIRSERRFASLEAKFPEDAKKLFAEAAQGAQDRYDNYVNMSKR